MIWFKLAWRNLWRNKRRSVIELIAIAGSVFIAVAFQNLASGSYEKIIDEGTRLGSGHIGFYHADYLEERKPSLNFTAAPIVQKAGAHPEVARVLPRTYVPGLIRSSRDSRPAVMLGLDFSKEAGLNPLLKPGGLVSGSFPDDSEGEDRTVPAVIGAALAEQLGIGQDKKFVFMAQGPDGQIQRKLLRVRGIFKTGVREFDAQMVMVPRAGLALFTGGGDRANEIALVLHDHKRVAEVLPEMRAIAARYDHVLAYPWDEAMPELSDAIKLDSSSLQITVFMLFMLVAVGTINTLLMSVMERVREFGLVRALGVNRAGIRKMILAEAAVLASTGIVIGTVLALLLTTYVYYIGIDLSGLIENQSLGGTFFEPIMYSTFDLPRMGFMLGAMFFLAIMSSLYPVHRALKIRPADAMRRY